MPQPVILQRLALGVAIAASLAAAGCGTVDRASQGFAGVLRPYRVEVVQGNFVSSEQVALLKPGISRLQVREILGTPLVTSVFHENRWDYVFTLRRDGTEPQQRRLTLFFKGDELERFEGDPMPSESEFVASLGARRASATGPVPVLEATPDQLQQAQKEARPAPAAADTPTPAAAPALPTSYPPLEPVSR